MNATVIFLLELNPESFLCRKTNKLQAISLCSRSKSTWLLVTSYYESEDENRDISIGSYYPIRLDKAPFLLLPQEIYDEGTPDRKYLYLYHLPTMCRSNEKRLEKNLMVNIFNNWNIELKTSNTSPLLEH